MTTADDPQNGSRQLPADEKLINRSKEDTCERA
jgi:hypothetical protein